MSNEVLTDKIVREAQDFQHLLITAKNEDPALAKALLGSVTDPLTAHGGALVVGFITFLSARYGFGWTDDTVALVSGLIVLIASKAIEIIQVVIYRMSLPITPKDTITVAGVTVKTDKDTPPTT